MFVERSSLEVVNSGLVDQLGGVDSHHSQDTFLSNWLAVFNMNLLFGTIVILIADNIDLGVAGDKLDHQFLSEPVSELKSRWFKEFISEVEVTFADEGFLINHEVIDPGLLFSFDDLVSAVTES
jgi:hypothetical protein